MEQVGHVRIHYPMQRHHPAKQRVNPEHSEIKLNNVFLMLQSIVKRILIM